MKKILFIVMLVLVSLSSLVANEINKRKVYALECSNNLVFTVSLEEGVAWLFLPEDTLSFKAEDSKRCNKFSKGDNFIGFKDDLAYLKLNAKTYHCQNNRKKSIIEKAKLDGYDFRATGNEPGWTLLIIGDTIIYSGDYGTTNYTFKKSKYITNKEEKYTIYTANTKEHKLSLKLEGKACLDTMSDDSYETSVSLEIDGKKLLGCGMALH